MKAVNGHLIAAVIAGSYLTLVLFDLSSAKGWMLPYALVMFVVAAYNLWAERA